MLTHLCFISLGNTCYMNATIQALRAVPELQLALGAYENMFFFFIATAFSSGIQARPSEGLTIASGSTRSVQKHVQHNGNCGSRQLFERIATGFLCYMNCCRLPYPLIGQPSIRRAQPKRQGFCSVCATGCVTVPFAFVRPMLKLCKTRKNATTKLSTV